MFKITTQIVNNQYGVVVSNGLEERLYWISENGPYPAGFAADSFRRDIHNHGESVVNFDNMPIVHQRLSQKGNQVRYTK